MTPPGPDDAGVAAAAPASSRAADLVEEAARTELERVRRRWSELSVGRAESAAARVRALVEELAARTGDPTAVPDLGPAVLADQLAVVVWDAYAAGAGDGIPAALTDLRRTLP